MLTFDYKPHNQFRLGNLILLLAVVTVQTSCKKLISIAPPVTQVNQADVYATDPTATAVLSSIYLAMNNSGGYSTGDNSIAVFTGLSSDELNVYGGVSSSSTKPYYYTNTLNASATGPTPGTEIWRLYSIVFTCNASIEGLTATTTLTPSVRQQLLGEAKFLRAFFYFYLVNLYGEIPLVIGTDWQANSQLSKSPVATVYQQIVEDLKDAQNLLSANYLDANLQPYAGTADRVRPSKWAATALLARTYLYTQKYDSAEAQSTSIITDASLFDTVPLNKVFLRNSKEAIWQLQPIGSGQNTQDGKLFILPSSGPNNTNDVYLNNSLLTSFEPGDQRAVLGNWINSVIYQVTPTQKDTAFYPYKYKAGANASIQSQSALTEFLMVLRLSEQYLIRAEARAQQGNIAGAQADLDIIRTRAGLPNTTANDKPSLISAILHERQVELFTEWGHRWLDLKRTGNVDPVMSVACQQKGGAWQSYQQLYPIPLDDILKDTKLTQNNGY